MAAPLNQNAEEDDQQWSSDFDNSVNAVYMGFVATAILISMFIVMAIIERFFRRPRTTSQLSDTTARTHFSYDNNPKLDHNSSKITNYAREVSVVMPGEDTPTFIAHPAPPPCPRERVAWPLHSINPSHASTSTPTPQQKLLSQSQT